MNKRVYSMAVARGIAAALTVLVSAGILSFLFRRLDDAAGYALTDQIALFTAGLVVFAAGAAVIGIINPAVLPEEDDPEPASIVRLSDDGTSSR